MKEAKESRGVLCPSAAENFHKNETIRVRACLPSRVCVLKEG